MTMHAITFSQFGDADVLQWSEVPVPEPGPGQVRVRTRAVSLNLVEVKIRRGELEAVFPTPLPAIPGSDVAGIVDAVGEGVTDVAVGDEVLGSAPGGAYAEYAVLTQSTAKPKSLPWELAASLPMIGETAWRAVKQLELSKGETLLVLGAAGNVGSVVTQLAVARGVNVIGAVGADDDDYLRSLGATPVRYGDGLVDRVRAIAPDGVSAALDTAGAGGLPDAIALAGGPNRVITLADMDAARHGVRFSGMDPSDRAPEALGEIVALAAREQLTLRIAKTYPLDQARTAQADLEAGRTRGKLVLVADHS